MSLRSFLSLILVLVSLVSSGRLEVEAQESPSAGKAAASTQKENERKPLIEWATSNIQYLYGFNWDLGKGTRDTMTFEHADAWRYGDNYFFLDVYNLAEHDRLLGDATYYGEWHPRFSLSRISGRNLSVGRIKDVLVSHEFTFAEGFLTYSSGVGFSLDLPHFDFANANFLVKDNIDQKGVTWQVILDWLIPFKIYGLPFSFGGYIDLGGAEENLGWTTYSDIQLLLDVGTFFGYENHAFFGVELRYIHNEFGIPDQDELVPQPMVKVAF